MKVIDLLNKIANGEEVPKKMLFNDFEWIYEKPQYRRTDKKISENLWSGYNFKILNDEVEVIEEDKKIDKDIKWYLIDIQEQEKTKIAQINMNFKIMREKLIEIIDKLNKEETK